MRVTTKLMSCMLTTMVIVAFVSAYLAIRSDRTRFEAQAKDEAERIANSIEADLARVLRESGVEEAVAMLRNRQVTGYDLRMRWVWFDQTGNDSFRPNVPRSELPELTPRRAVSIHVTDNTGDHLTTYWPLQMDDRMGGVEFSRSTEELQESHRITLWRTIILIVSLVSIGSLTMWIGGIVFVGAPLKRLIEKTRRMGDGDLTTPVHVASQDEMGELARSLNTLSAQLDSSLKQVANESQAKLDAMEQLQHADRLRTVGQLASGIAHELGTPLNVVTGRAELIGSGELSDEQVVKGAAAIQRESRRMTELIQRLLDFARRQPPQKIQTDVRKLVTDTADLLKPMARKQNVEIQVTHQCERCEAAVDPSQLQQVVTNLTMNAIQSMPDGGRVAIHTTNTDHEISIAIADQGVGIRDEDLDHLFEPFFTTKEPGHGTGLGLSIAHRIVEEHHGRIEVDSRTDIGTVFTISLPYEEPTG